ncbi:hypothetical protein JRO89_XS11G0155000 [Xanthoceras sorbifolium]|uniref:Uncharacterized protein n=1 Tax=Xanthoceras sorbifolium TaxID=99658 RepID=A0ABQ8HFN2_9ROSI|nr:hypothetical protein JRO89_XS11G0155000 [Xanthoceras sorbifolium]
MDLVVEDNVDEQLKGIMGTSRNSDQGVVKEDMTAYDMGECYYEEKGTIFVLLREGLRLSLEILFLSSLPVKMQEMRHLLIRCTFENVAPLSFIENSSCKQGKIPRTVVDA